MLPVQPLTPISTVWLFLCCRTEQTGTRGQFKNQRTHFVPRNGAALRALAGKMWVAFRQVKSLTHQAPIWHFSQTLISLCCCCCCLNIPSGQHFCKNAAVLPSFHAHPRGPVIKARSTNQGLWWDVEHGWWSHEPSDVPDRSVHFAHQVCWACCHTRALHCCYSLSTWVAALKQNYMCATGCSPVWAPKLKQQMCLDSSS